MTASEFDKLTRKTRVALEAQKESPERLERMLLERIQNGMSTYDSTVLEVVYAWRNYESMTGARPFTRTLQLISSLLQQANHQPMLHAALAAINGDIFHEHGNLQSAVAAYADAVDDLHALHTEVDTKWIYSMVRFGQILLLQDNKLDAEKLFLDVLSYPWYLVMEAEVQPLLRHDYISAGLGLIECRRGDLPALQEIFFVPATQAELLPALELAIDEARSSPE